MNVNSNISLKYIYDTWVKVIYDLVYPDSRSVYDSFWVNDRPLVIGITFICVSIILILLHVLDYVFA